MLLSFRSDVKECVCVCVGNANCFLKRFSSVIWSPLEEKSLLLVQ